MIDLTKIELINGVIEAYFEKNSALTIVPVKQLMPDFIAAKIFTKDHKNGMPIRKILRELDKEEQLQLIPFVHADRKAKDIYWYFIPANTEAPTTSYKQSVSISGTQKNTFSADESDEAYVIDLCDEVLGRKANRQKRFPFLVGDLHKDGKNRTRLPVDAYYTALELVVEYREIQHSEEVPHFDKPEQETISGVTRAEQRRIYDLRREEVLPEHGIELVIISYSDFKLNADNRIQRDEEKDTKIVRKALKKYIRKK